ncbi:hypothetical protein Droror1_Dr00024302, partial [Drosera rotundifolia]
MLMRGLLMVSMKNGVGPARQLHLVMEWAATVDHFSGPSLLLMIHGKRELRCIHGRMSPV